MGFGILLIVLGGFTVFCAIQDYDWFMNSSKARLWLWLLGRQGTRVFYVLLGLFITGIGIAGLLGRLG